MNTKRTSHAIVFDAPGQPLHLEEIELPSLGEQDVLVRVVCCTLCGSDIHSYTGNRGTPCPTVLGHEILGRIYQLPPSEPLFDIQGQPLREGDRVTWSVAASCGKCFYCQNELPQKCESLFKYGHESTEKHHPLSGGLAEHCVLVPGTAILKVPDSLPDTVVCPVNCATATVAAAYRYAGDCSGEVVLIQGAGMLGLTASAMAHSQGARDVIITDVSNERLEVAELFGATATISVSQGTAELSKVIEERTEGRGVDLAIEVCGVTESVKNCLEYLRIGGRCICVGSTFPSEPLPISIESIVRRIQRIQGIHNYAPIDLYNALQFLTKNAGRYPFESLVKKTFTLEEASDAFQYAIHHNDLRVAVIPYV